MIDKTTVYITTQRGIPLGYQGENEAREIVFPQPEELLAENWMLLHQRALDKEPYPGHLDVTARGLVWTVTAGDTDISGTGRAQLICTGADGEVLKTCTYSTTVSKSLHVGGEPPDPVKPWYDAIMEALEEGGGVKTAIFKVVQGDPMSLREAGVTTASAGDNARGSGDYVYGECENMTYEEAKAMLFAGKVLAGAVVNILESGGVTAAAMSSSGASLTARREISGPDVIDVEYYGGLYYWHPDGTLTDNPNYGQGDPS